MQTIEDAIHTFVYKQDDQTVIGVFEAIRMSMNEGKSFYIPVQYLNEEKTEFSLGKIKDGKGQEMVVVFSNEEGCKKMEEAEVLEESIQSFLTRIMEMPDIAGLLINPIGEGFVLGKKYIQMIFDANQKLQA